MWSRLPKLTRFRHSAWIHDNILSVLGGFEYSAPTTAITKQMAFNLSEFIELRRSNSPDVLGSPKRAGVKSSRSAPKIERIGEDFFKLSPRVMVAVRSTPEISPAMHKMMKSIPVRTLNAEGKKLLASNKVLLGPELQEKEMGGEKITQRFINQLLRPKDSACRKLDRLFPFTKDQILVLTYECIEVVKAEPTVVKVTIPVKVFGDFHGQYQDMMRFFELWRSPIESIHGGDIESYDYLFLGDYIDRGTNNLEVICLLMALKVKFPRQIHLLRGNHEDHAINRVFGFAEECEERLDDDIDDDNSVFQTINFLFDLLPLAAVVEERILCVHGGIGATLKSVADLEKIERPVEIVHEVKTALDQLLIDVLWSDPTENDQELGIHNDAARDPYDTGYIVKYGPDRVENFLRENNLTMIIRGHECVMDGIERFAKGQLITVFSATDYCGKYKNAGGALFIQKDYQIVPKLIYPVDMDKELHWMEQKKSQTPPNWKDNPNDKSFG
eukprot:TRINITY_DN15282_c0_g1_i2.p1 TRINITY_DN15282_c0_g1~~TRINITY_DN15282_c0_g1_i2.p1  ORF type:complete len:500 (+),score=97.61 TRINITY_DN15282_c0_g1_i2:205-1704(+)